MKKKITISVLSILSSIIIHAQVDFGYKVGINFANVYADYTEALIEPNTNYLNRFHAGLFLNLYGKSKLVNFNLGIKYTGKGFKYDLRSYSGIKEGEEIVKLNYLQMPLKLRFQNNNFSATMGAYLGVLISGQGNYEVTNLNDEIIVGKYVIKPKIGDAKLSDYKVNEQPLSALELGLNFGLGYQIQGFGIELNYEIGLSNLNPAIESSSESKNPNKLKNRVFSISFLYCFIKAEK